ncbi:MAG TPA: YifB family Mg chelatase-like AAA ATPase [Streptosporangiaceae bacterium]|jgi:magnesium chelatase family protein
MAMARTRCVAVVGVEGHPIDVEADVADGLVGLNIVGLPDTALREARDRIRAAVDNSGVHWPTRRITVGLSPASLPKRGSGYDAAIAVAILAAAGEVPAAEVADRVFLGELGLDGQIRPVRGVLPAVLGAVTAGYKRVVVAPANATEARLVPEVEVTAAPSLVELIGVLRGELTPDDLSPGHPSATMPPPPPGYQRRSDVDLADVAGQPVARRAVEISAAGGHHLFLIGSPGSGKTMLAERLPTILPPLTTEQALEVTAIHSVAGMLPSRRPLVAEPPFCAPHHTSTRTAIIGGGSTSIRPGAASLAHRGVLFIDEAPECGRGMLDSLRQPLESGEVLIARAAVVARFPAAFTLVMAANPCPCARADTASGACTCTPGTKRDYLARLSGPLLDRVDLKIRMTPPSRRELLADQSGAEPSAAVAERVRAARSRATHRLAGTPWRTNAQVPGRELRRAFAPPPEALACLDTALRRGELTARGVDRVIRVAWTVADLTAAPEPGPKEMNYALALWLGTT